MGNFLYKQQNEALTVDMYVVEYREHQQKVKAIVKRLNTGKRNCFSLSEPESQHCSETEYLHVVQPLQMLAKLPKDQMWSQIQLLSFLSKKLCRQLATEGICCWFKLKGEHIRGDTDMQSTRDFGIDDIAFGTFETAISFVTSSAPESTATPDATYKVQFRKKERKIRLTIKVGRQLFSLEIEHKHMHHIIHVVRRENRFDVYFQLRQPPLMYERINVDARRANSHFVRRSYLSLHGVTSDEIGRCDILRVSFDDSMDDTNLHEIFSDMAVGDNPPWELRFTWIAERKTNIAATVETGLSSFAVLYASKVLQSVGLRCQLINCLDLLKGLPENLHAELLYEVAERYESESEYYLIDINKVTRRQTQTGKRNSSASKDSMKLRNAILTPTRIIFRRPSECEPNRVFNKYFSGDGAQYVMKVYFRDEDVQTGTKNLNFILNATLDHQVGYADVYLDPK